MTGHVHVPDRVAHLAPYVEAGVFDAGEIQLCDTVARLVPGLAPEALLALAVAARGPRLGHVCVDLDAVAQLVVDRSDEIAAGVAWPDPDRWIEIVAASPITVSPADQRATPLRPLVLAGRQIYLQRLHVLEDNVASQIERRSTEDVGGWDVALVEEALDAVFGPIDPARTDRQRDGARTALTGNLTVLAGGPGTGKTHTIARILAAGQQIADRLGRHWDVALTAPTGKAAARMTEALQLAVERAHNDGVLDDDAARRLADRSATTIHQLLKAMPNRGFRKNADDPLPHDLVIVDETSMVSLPTMAALLEAVRPDASIVLVGDPDQLASIEAGTVMSDLVGPVGSRDEDAASVPLFDRVVLLDRSHRFDEDSAIAELAGAIRTGDTERAIDVLDGPSPAVEWIRDSDDDRIAALTDSVVSSAATTIAAARAGETDAGLDAMQEIKVLAATRHLPLGVYDWTERIERLLDAGIPDLRTSSRWYVGRPILVTRNDHPNDLHNGDTGLVVRDGDTVSVFFRDGAKVRSVPPVKLDLVETWWAMTIHKSQGSEFPHVVVSLPPATSPILTRELLYTGVTRGKDRVTVVGSEEALRAAIARPVARASGLRDRLWPT